MGLRLQRALGDVASLGPGQYTRRVAPLAGKVALSCPICGVIDTLADGHVIDRAGRVTPAFRCSRCPFWDWLELDGIDYPAAAEMHCAMHGYYDGRQACPGCAT